VGWKARERSTFPTLKGGLRRARHELPVRRRKATSKERAETDLRRMLHPGTQRGPPVEEWPVRSNVGEEMIGGVESVVAHELHRAYADDDV
jgi:hypothetical protein